MAPLRTPITFAILHVAIFDAVNAVDRQYRGYASEFNAPGAQRDVAAAQAAHDVMVAMFPAQRATFDAALAVTLGRASGDTSESPHSDRPEPFGLRRSWDA